LKCVVKECDGIIGIEKVMSKLSLILNENNNNNVDEKMGERYFKKVVDGMEMEKKKEWEKEMKKEMEKEKQRKLSDYILNEILTLRCRGCGCGVEVENGFDGCFKMICANEICSNKFCGFCWKDFGKDGNDEAYKHIPICDKNIFEKKGIFAPKDKDGKSRGKEFFEMAQKKRKQNELNEYWKRNIENENNEMKMKVIEMVKVHIESNGLKMPTN